MFRLKAFKPKTTYLILLSLVVVEYLFFRNYVSRELVWGYPQHSDQLWYLSSSYAIYERLLSHDFHSILSLLQSTPQGILLQMEGAFFFLFSGASRLNALTLNFLHLTAAQLFLFLILKSITNRLSISLMALGFLLLLNVTFFDIGGMADYRLEFGAFCLSVIFLGSVIRSSIFLDKKWSVVAAVMASLLILHRFLYFIFILGTTGVFFAVVLFLNLPPPEQRAICLRNLALFGLLTFVFTLPALFLSRSAILSYYYSNSLGPTKYIWAEVAGVRNLTDVILFYPKWFVLYYWGPSAAVIAIGITISLLLMNRQNKHSSKIDFPFKSGFLFLALFSAVPLGILNFITSKNGGLANVFVAPVFWLFLLLFIYLHRVKRNGQSHAFGILSSLVLLMGLSCFCYSFGRHSASFYEKQDRERVVQMYKDIGRYYHDEKVGKVLIFFDHIADYYGAKLLEIINYEETGNYIEAHSMTSINAISEKQVVQALGRTDIIVFNSNEYSAGQTSAFPYIKDIKKFKPLFKNRTREMTKVGSYSVFGNEIHVYARPRPRFAIEGITGGWLLPEETYLSIPTDVLKEFSAVVISGTSAMQFVKGLEVLSENSNKDSGPEIASRIIMDDSKYLIYCAWPPYKTTPEDRLRIKLRFNKYFIPKELNINEDTRRLVVMAPKEKATLSDLKEVSYPSDQKFICGIYGDGFAKSLGVSFVLVSGKRTIAKKLKLLLDVPLPINSPFNSVPVEILLDKHVVAEEHLKREINELTIDIPPSLRKSNLLEVQIRPKFDFIPSETFDGKGDRKLSFIFKRAFLED